MPPAVVSDKRLRSTIAEFDLKAVIRFPEYPGYATPRRNRRKACQACRRQMRAMSVAPCRFVNTSASANPPSDGDRVSVAPSTATSSLPPCCPANPDRPGLWMRGLRVARALFRRPCALCEASATASIMQNCKGRAVAFICARALLAGATSAGSDRSIPVVSVAHSVAKRLLRPDAPSSHRTTHGPLRQRVLPQVSRSSSLDRKLLD